MMNKVCIVTGATSGIGKATAQGLAEMGATVVLTGRVEQRTRPVVEQIKAQTGRSTVDYLVADLSSQDAIRELAREFKRHYQRLDVLINNAGAMFLRRQENRHGLEMTFAVNHLSYFLLTNLLLDRMIQSAPSRIINVASNAHRRAVLDFDDLQNKRRYWGLRAYAQSKLANVLFTYELARRLESTGVTVNALHPGFVATNMGTNNGPVVRLLLPLIHRNSLTADEGAQTSLYLASSPIVEKVTGKYFHQKAEEASSEVSYDTRIASRLWRISAELMNLSKEEQRLFSPNLSNPYNTNHDGCQKIQ